jgi:hypothetical protein
MGILKSGDKYFVDIFKLKNASFIRLNREKIKIKKIKK